MLFSDALTDVPSFDSGSISVRQPAERRQRPQEGMQGSVFPSFSASTQLFIKAMDRGRSLGDVLGAHLMLWGEPTCLLTRDCPWKACECACQGHTLSWTAAGAPSRSFCFCPCPISICPQCSSQGRHSKTFLIESLQHLESFQSSLAYSG